jgi:hypothetical protein
MTDVTTPTGDAGTPILLQTRLIADQSALGCAPVSPGVVPLAEVPRKVPPWSAPDHDVGVEFIPRHRYFLAISIFERGLGVITIGGYGRLHEPLPFG